jgi:hypothetical protein
MNSFTSGFKVFAPLCAAVICIALVELLCAAFVKEPAFLKSPLLHMAYRQPVRTERVISAVKLHTIMPLPGSILQVGDSSGLAGVQPRIVNTYLPAGLQLLNLSMQVPAQFVGHESTAEAALRAHPDAKYLLLMVSPFHIGRDDEGFGEDIERNYVRFPWVSALPSLRARALVVNAVFYGRGAGGSLWFDGTSIGAGADPLLSKIPRDFFEDVVETLGWMKLNRHQNFMPHPCGLSNYNDGLVTARLQRIYEIAARHRAGLILVLGPMKCTPDEETEKLETTIRRFQSTHPDMVIPLPVFDAINPADIGDDVHLTPEGSRRYSERLGAALRHTLEQ